MAASLPVGSTPGTAQWNANVNYFANQLNGQYPGNLTGENVTLAQDYIAYMEANPNADPATVYAQVLGQLNMIQQLPGALGGDIASGLTKTGNVTGSIPGALPGLNPANDVPGLSGLNAIGDFFSRLSEKNTWIRIGEGAAALILLDIGLKAFTGHSVIETAGKTAAKGAKTGAMFA